MNSLKLLSIALISSGLLLACNKEEDAVDNQEVGQQIGDVMASVDEAGQSSGTLASNELQFKEGVRKTFKRLAPQDTPIFSSLFPQAFAASCSSAPGFGSCSGFSITRDFAGCTVGQATFNGTVILTWGGAGVTNCSLGTAGSHITRVPDFSVSGLRNATLDVEKTGSIGQRITWDSGSGTNKAFSVTNDGVRRTFSIAGSTLFDYTTTITSPISVVGTTRASRVMTGGNLRVTNNNSGNVCNFVPTNVTWNNSSCNCPTSGTWAGSCSSGGTASVTITGCGTADLTIGDESESISFDRCSN